VDVTFEVAGKTYVVAEPQATILAENLRILSKSELDAVSDQAVLLGDRRGWRPSAEALADSIEAALVDGQAAPLTLEGMSADATYCVLRVMVGLDTDEATGLRDALGAPVTEHRMRGQRLLMTDPRQLSRSEMIELLTILFVLAVLTIVAGVAWTESWYVLAPVIAALLGIRVATTRSTGRFAWSVASVVWFGILLVPAAVLVALLALLVLAVIR
jgi:hypothetical protein